MPFADLLRRANLRLVTGSGKSEATFGNPKPKFSTHSFGCHFVEVTWQPEIARLRVSRVVTVIDAGRILNPLAGRNQIEGAVVMGIGMALFEHTILRPAERRADQQQPGRLHRGGRTPTCRRSTCISSTIPTRRSTNLARAESARSAWPAFAAAITAAVHHATGVRVRELPVKIEDLLA